MAASQLVMPLGYASIKWMMTERTAKVDTNQIVM